MNARKFLNVRVSLTVTALALSAAVGISSLTTSCASSPSSGGSTGSGGTSNGGSGGSGGGGSGGSAGSGGGGGAGGEGGTTTTGSCPNTITNGVNFCDGQAQGDLFKGYAYVAIGVQDSMTSPQCAEDPNDLTKLRDIAGPPVGECTAEGKTCPTSGRTVWPDSDKLCIKGSMPQALKVDGKWDYDSSWGLQIGVNTDSPPAAEGGKTLGEQFPDAAKFTSITLTTSGAPDPNKAVIRVEIHIKSQTCTELNYCSTLKDSGKPLPLSAFNTECWAGSNCNSATDGKCFELKAEDIPNIDKIGVQLSGDEKLSYKVDNYCLEKIEFGTD